MPFIWITKKSAVDSVSISVLISVLAKKLKENAVEATMFAATVIYYITFAAAAFATGHEKPIVIIAQ